MTVQQVTEDVDVVSRRHNLRAWYGISIGLLLLAFIALNYVTFMVSQNSMSRYGFLQQIAVSYEGIDQVEYGAPRSHSIDVLTTDGQEIRCEEPTLAELNDRKPLECENGAVTLKYKDA